VVRVNFLLQLAQSLHVPIVDLLEIIAFKFLGLGFLAIRAHLSLLALTPFIECCEELVSSHQ
jgi:hypothetical protein